MEYNAIITITGKRHITVEDILEQEAEGIAQNQIEEENFGALKGAECELDELREVGENSYQATFLITGTFRTSVTASCEEEAGEVAENEFASADFGVLEEPEITDIDFEDGDYEYECDSPMMGELDCY